MSILNRPGDGLVSVLVALVRTSAMIGSTERDKLLNIVSPKSLNEGKNDQDMAIKTLNRWKELGLFVQNEKGDVKLSEECRALYKSSNGSLAAIAQFSGQLALAPENNQNFWSDTDNKSADFSRATAWMLAQDIYDFVPTSYAVVEPICNEQVLSSDVILLQNDTRWAGYGSWATFLGFGRFDSGKASGRLITDPTPVVRFHLEDLLPKRGEVAINDFISDLGTKVPVLDGGDYRREVESKLKSDKWKKPKEGELSTSLSRALLRLRESGHIRFEARSDAGAQMKLIGREGRVVESVTHVRKGESK